MITNEILYHEIQTLKKLIRLASIEEVSLNRACKILHIGYDKMVELILSKKIKARPVNSKKSSRGLSYKIKIADIQEFQNKSEVDLRLVKFKSVEQIVKEAL